MFSVLYRQVATFLDSLSRSVFALQTVRRSCDEIHIVVVTFYIPFFRRQTVNYLNSIIGSGEQHLSTSGNCFIEAAENSRSWACKSSIFVSKFSHEGINHLCFVQVCLNFCSICFSSQQVWKNPALYFFVRMVLLTTHIFYVFYHYLTGHIQPKYAFEAVKR